VSQFDVFANRGRAIDGTPLLSVLPINRTNVMIPESFISKYPCVAAVLDAMTSPGMPSMPPDTIIRAKIAVELEGANEDVDSIALLFHGLFGTLEPDGEFMRFGIGTYIRLGVNDLTRRFVGQLWAEAFRQWEPTQRAEFLSLTVNDDREVFLAIDLCVEVFRAVRFATDEAFQWIAAAHEKTRRDGYQRGFWACVEAYCATSPLQAIAVAERWLAVRSDSSSLGVVENMVGWLRFSVASEPSASLPLASLEKRIQSPGSSVWRALYVRSWSLAAGEPMLDEAKALGIRDQFVRANTEEEIAWCFLLNAITHSDRGAWPWVHREFKAVARASLSDEAKYWTVMAALHGIETGTERECAIWRGVLVAVLPISAGHIPSWRTIHQGLLTLTEKNSSEMCALAVTLGRCSGATWLHVLRERGSDGFFESLRQRGLHAPLSGDLCFQPGSASRRMGLYLFSECEVARFGLDVTEEASESQLELLLLEAQRHSMRFEALARLHACLAHRVDVLGGSLPELLYDEIAKQCLNTRAYRLALLAAAPGDEYLAAILADSEERLDLTSGACKSPALQMEVVGQMRAEMLSQKRMAREVGSAVRRRSIFMSTLRNVSLLYGENEWRSFMPDGSLSKAHGLKLISESIEVPRLEFLDPEGMFLHRLAASTRIRALEAALGGNDLQ